MKDNTFLIIIITITIIILFICECNKDLIEGMVVFKWYDVNNVALGPKYNQCIDSISQRIKSSSSNEIATLSTLLTDGMNGCADTYLNQDIPTVKNALVARFQAEAAERVHEEKLKDESIYEPELLPDGSPNEKYGELKDDIKEQLRIQDQRKAELTDCSQCPGPDLTITDDVIKTSSKGELDSGCLNKRSERCNNCSKECLNINNREQKRRNKLISIESNKTLLGATTVDSSGKENFEYDYIVDLQESKDPLVKRLVKDFISERSATTPSNEKCVGISSQYDDICNIKDPINETNCNSAGGGPNGNCIFYGGYERNNLINNRNSIYSSGQSGIVEVQNQLTELQQTSSQQRENDQNIILQYRNLINLISGCPGDSCPVTEGDDNSIRNYIENSISQLQEKDNLLQSYRSIKENLPQSYQTKIQEDSTSSENDPTSSDNIDTITKREIQNTINDYSTSINNFTSINEVLPEDNRPTDPFNIRNAITGQMQNYTTQLNNYSSLADLSNVNTTSSDSPENIKTAIENSINTCNTELTNYSGLSNLQNVNSQSTDPPQVIRTAVETTVNNCNTDIDSYQTLSNLPNVNSTSNSPQDIKTAIENSINDCNTNLTNYAGLSSLPNVNAQSTDLPQDIRNALETTINSCNTNLSSCTESMQILENIYGRFITLLDLAGNCDPNVQLDDNGDQIAACTEDGKYKADVNTNNTCCPNDNSPLPTCSDDEKQNIPSCTPDQETFIIDSRVRNIRAKIYSLDGNTTLLDRLNNQLNLYRSLDDAEWMTPEGGTKQTFEDDDCGDSLHPADSYDDDCKTADQKRTEYINERITGPQGIRTTLRNQLTSCNEATDNISAITSSR